MKRRDPRTGHDQISPQELRLYQTMRQDDAYWFTNGQLASKAKVAPKTARAYTLAWWKLGMIRRAEVFPAYRFQWIAQTEKRNEAYVNRLNTAGEVVAQSSHFKRGRKA